MNDEKMKTEGNVVIGFTSQGYLMLDCDQQKESKVIKFSEEYPKFHSLGSSLVMKSSEDGQVDLSGEKLGHYFIIFGKPLNQDAIYWHLQEACRLGLVNRAFVEANKYGNITLRLNAKNGKIPPPTYVSYFQHGEFTGVHTFLKDWINLRKLG
jgi:hypothetical protein